MVENHCKKTITNNCTFVNKHTSDDFIILVSCVDGVMIDGHGPKKTDVIKKALSKLFPKKYLDLIKLILETKIIKYESKRLLWLS